MGDSDIEQYFETGNDLSDWVKVDGSHVWSQGSYGVTQIDNRNSMYKLNILRNTETSFFAAICAAGIPVSGVNNFSWALVLELSDGNFYTFEMAMNDVISTTIYPYMRYGKLASRPVLDTADNNPNSLTSGGTSTIPSQGDPQKWTWFFMEFKSNGNVDIHYTRDTAVHNASVPDYTYSEALALKTLYVTTAMTWSGAKIIGVYVYADIVNATNNTGAMSNIYIEADAPTGILGNASLNVQNRIARQRLGVGNDGTVTEAIDYSTYDFSKIESNINKSVIIQDNTYGLVWGKGEIKRYSFKDYDIIEWIYENVGKKLQDTVKEITPPKKIRIDHLKDSLVFNRYLTFSALSPIADVDDWINKVLTFEDTDYYSYITHPKTVTYQMFNDDIGVDDWETATSDVVVNDYKHLYFANNGAAYTDLSYGLWHERQLGSNYSQHRVQMGFDLIYKDSSSLAFDDIKLRVIFRTTGLQSVYIDNPYYPAIKIKNQTSGNWETLFQWDENTVDTRNMENTEDWDNPELQAETVSALSPIIEKELSISDIVGDWTAFKADYMVTPVTYGDFKASAFEIAIEGAQTENLAQNPAIEVHYAGVTFNQPIKNVPQISGVSNGIVVGNDDDYIQVNASGVTPGFFPIYYGFNSGDWVYLTDNIQTQITEVFSNIAEFDVEFDFNNDYTYDADIKNDKTETVSLFLDRICAAYNWIWYIRLGVTTNTVVITDHLNSTSITLTDADLVEPPQVEVLGYDVHENIKVLGAFGLSADKTNAGIGNTFGDETRIYKNPNLRLQTEVDNFAQSKKTLHSALQYFVVAKIGLTNPVQNYSALEIGKSVSANFTGMNGAETLMIHEAIYIKLANSNEYLELVLRSRNL